jgi:hypothetical protein
LISNYWKLKQKIIKLHNRWKNAYKFTVNWPLHSKQFLDFTPRLADVHANSTFEISAVFKPNIDFLNILKKYIDIRNSTEVEKKIKIPVKVIVTNQSIPILFDIIAILTTDEVEI